MQKMSRPSIVNPDPSIKKASLNGMYKRFKTVKHSISISRDNLRVLSGISIQLFTIFRIYYILSFKPFKLPFAILEEINYSKSEALSLIRVIIPGFRWFSLAIFTFLLTFVTNFRTAHISPSCCKLDLFNDLRLEFISRGVLLTLEVKAFLGNFFLIES